MLTVVVEFTGSLDLCRINNAAGRSTGRNNFNRLRLNDIAVDAHRTSALIVFGDFLTFCVGANRAIWKRSVFNCWWIRMLRNRRVTYDRPTLHHRHRDFHRFPIFKLDGNGIATAKP